MFSDVSLALAALALFVAVCLWCGLSDDRRIPRPDLAPSAPPPIPSHRTFTPRALVSHDDAQSLALVKDALARVAPELYAQPQVPLAAIVTLPPGTDRAQAAAIATRRVEIAILDHRHFPRAVITRAPADPVTALALARAGIPLLQADPAQDLPARLEAILTPAQAGITASPSRR
jgi:hypothetical protein